MPLHEIIADPQGKEFSVRRDGRIIAVGLPSEAAAKAHAKRCDYDLHRWRWEKADEPLLGEADWKIIARYRGFR